MSGEVTPIAGRDTAAKPESTVAAPDGSTVAEPDGATAERDSTIAERLQRDEDRLALDERQLTEHDVRLAAGERGLGRSRLEFAAVAFVLAVALAGLVVGLVALNRDVDRLANRAPDGSVGTTAIQRSAVTAERLATDAVTGAVIRAGAIGTDEIASRAITAEKVQPDALTGATIREQTLGRVPVAMRADKATVAGRAVRARTARRAVRAGSAQRLGGLPPNAFLSDLTVVRAATATDTMALKGPLAARCPTGTSVMSGGVGVYGATSGVAILRDLPAEGDHWVGLAQASRAGSGAWRLEVRAVCARGGARSQAGRRRGDERAHSTE